MSRGLGPALVALALWVTPAVALAAMPTLSPALDGVLADPPSPDYLEMGRYEPGAVAGSYDIDRYARLVKSSDGAQVKSRLQQNGFVAGFGRTWVQPGTLHVLVEVVVAFTGAAGANSWLSDLAASDRTDVNYRGAISVSGIDTYYGAHFFSLSSLTYADSISFVKGNDYFIVATVTVQDESGASVTKQAQKQYRLAPEHTIPKSQWPESAGASGTSSERALLPVEQAVLILGAAGVASALLLLARRRRARHAAEIAPELPPAPSA